METGKSIIDRSELLDRNNGTVRERMRRNEGSGRIDEPFLNRDWNYSDADFDRMSKLIEVGKL